MPSWMSSLTLSNQRIAVTPSPASEFVLKPSLLQVHGKAREAQGTGTGSLLGAAGTSGSVSELLSKLSPCLLEFPRWEARGLSEPRAKPGAGEEARRVAWCQGAGRSAVSSALGARPALRAAGRSSLARLSLPPAGGVYGGRSADSVPVHSRRCGKAGVQEELSPRSRAERRGCPNSRSRSAPPLGAAAAAPAVGCGAELQAAPRVPGRRHLRGTRAARSRAGQRPGRARGS